MYPQFTAETLYRVITNMSGDDGENKRLRRKRKKIATACAYHEFYLTPGKLQKNLGTLEKE